MGKLRFCILFFIPFAFVSAQNVAPDTLKRFGFENYKQAGDTIWARLAAKKLSSLKKFTLGEADFIAETRKHDTSIAQQMIHGEWLVYWYHVDKSFKKVYNALKKEKIDFKKAKLDTILMYTNTGNPDLNRGEIYFVRNKKRGYIKFEMWRVNGLWYLNGKLDFIDDPMPVKLK